MASLILVLLGGTQPIVSWHSGTGARGPGQPRVRAEKPWLPSWALAQAPRAGS